MAVSAVEKMTFWPELRYAREVAIFTDASSYFLKCLSYWSASYFSLLKCCQRFEFRIWFPSSYQSLTFTAS